MYQAKDPIRSVEDLQPLLGEMHPSQVNKIIDHIDDHCRAWIDKTTFVSIASCNAKGQMDVSPKGDPAGFIKVLDSKTLAVPEFTMTRRGPCAGRASALRDQSTGAPGQAFCVKTPAICVPA